MKRAFLVLILFSIQLNVYAQSKKRISLADSIVYTFLSHYTVQGAKSDIESCRIKILLPGGWGGMPSFSVSDRKFERKYGITFFSQGCIQFPDDGEDGYNKAIFSFLDITYGVAWRMEIRRDAIGLYTE